MRRRLAKRLRLVLLLAAAGAAAAGAGPASGPELERSDLEEQAFSGEVSVGFVLVPVVVRTPGGFARGLDRRDFELRVDGKPAAIESFESGSQAPVGILFLQDLSGSMGVPPKLERSRALIECILAARRPGDEFAVASFSDEQLFVEVPFPGSPPTITELASTWEGYGRTALHDAVAWLPDIVHARASPRRAVVLVTDGVDNASETAPAQARAEIRQAEVPVHVVGLETGSVEALLPDGEKLHQLADVLNLIGWATGGGYHPVATPEGITGACHAIVEDLRNQYVLGFSTRGDGAAATHRIEVLLRGKGKKFRVDHRRSYEGTPPRTMRPPR